MQSTSNYKSTFLFSLHKDANDMTDDLTQLPPPEKKVAAKVLYCMGWGSRKIEEWLGIDHSTVIRYANEAIPDEMRQFATEFEAAIQDMKREGLAKVYLRILELIPKERRIDQVVRAGEYFEGISRARTDVKVSSTAVAIANADRNTLSNQELATWIYSFISRLDNLKETVDNGKIEETGITEPSE